MKVTLFDVVSGLRFDLGLVGSWSSMARLISTSDCGLLLYREVNR